MEGEVRRPVSNRFNFYFLPSSPIWAEIDDSIKTELEHEVDYDGEWWMDVDDFRANFNDVDICHRVPFEFLVSQFVRFSLIASRPNRSTIARRPSTADGTRRRPADG